MGKDEFIEQATIAAIQGFAANPAYFEANKGGCDIGTYSALLAISSLCSATEAWKRLQEAKDSVESRIQSESAGQEAE